MRVSTFAALGTSTHQMENHLDWLRLPNGASSLAVPNLCQVQWCLRPQTPKLGDEAVVTQRSGFGHIVQLSVESTFMRGVLLGIWREK